MIIWIGGSPCSGKSTIAERLCDDFDFDYYKCDDHLDRFLQLGVEMKKPIMLKFSAMDINQTWIERSVDEQVRDEVEFYEVAFEIILNDLASRQSTKPLVVEGAACMPSNIAKHNICKENYICIVPTSQFQNAQYARRDWVNSYLSSCRDINLAFTNWMKRDEIFAQKVLSDAQQMKLKYLLVDGNATIEENYQFVVETLLSKEHI